MKAPETRECVSPSTNCSRHGRPGLMHTRSVPDLAVVVGTVVAQLVVDHPHEVLVRHDTARGRRGTSCRPAAWRTPAAPPPWRRCRGSAGGERVERLEQHVVEVRVDAVDSIHQLRCARILEVDGLWRAGDGGIQQHSDAVQVGARTALPAMRISGEAYSLTPNGARPRGLAIGV